jgi:hypothetical protein
LRTEENVAGGKSDFLNILSLSLSLFLPPFPKMVFKMEKYNSQEKECIHGHTTVRIEEFQESTQRFVSSKCEGSLGILTNTFCKREIPQYSSNSLIMNVI